MILKSFVWILFTFFWCWVTKFIGDRLEEKSFFWWIFNEFNFFLLLVLFGSTLWFLVAVGTWMWPILWS